MSFLLYKNGGTLREAVVNAGTVDDAQVKGGGCTSHFFYYPY